MSTTTSSLAFYDDSAQGWERALYAFLGEKQRRSGSRRTVDAYSRMIQDFFGRAGKPPDQVVGQEVFAWAHGRGLSGKEPSAITVGARMACLSSFYRFLIRMGIVSSNPCDALERPRISAGPPRGLSAEEIRRLLAAIPDTKPGLRDRAIVLTLALTGRRRTEVIDMTRGDLSEENDAVYYRYRGKGGKKAKRELPRPAYDAIETALGGWGKSLTALDAKESLWPTDDADRAGKGLGVTSGTFYGNLQRYLRAAGLPAAGVHILRHSAAKLRRDAGESVEDVSRFLDHSSLAVTTVYLRRLEGQEDRSWRSVAEAIGV
jgi:integrase/recombinase XerC